MRLIDAEELREQLFSYYCCVNEDTCKSNYNGERLMAYEVADMMADCFDNVPTIDPVHAAGACYCRECKHGRKPYRNTAPEMYYKSDCVVCECYDVVGNDPTIYVPDHFCSYGRRREQCTKEKE